MPNTSNSRRCIHLATVTALAAIAVTAVSQPAPVHGDAAGAQAAPPKKRAAKKKTKKAKPKPGSEKAVRAFMRAKLGAMRQVLRGIVTEDYDLIRKNAEKMKSMGTQVEWNVVQGAIYGNYSASFRQSADMLIKAARDKSSDGAALVYMRMTLNCIECHKYTRGPNVKKTYRVD